MVTWLNGDINPGNCESVLQAQHGDCGTVVGPWVELYPKGCDILSLVNVVVQVGRQGLDTVGGDW